MSEIKVNSVVNSTGDNDSGLDLSTNDQVIIKTANTTAVTVDSSQGVTVAGAFTSRGIDDNADATAITIDSSENVKVGGIETSQTSPLMVKTNASNYAIYLEENSGQESWQIGVNSTGDLDFRNSGGTDPAITFNDSGQLCVGATSAGLHKAIVKGDTGGNAVFKVQNSASSGNVTTYISFMDGSGANSVNSAHFQGFNGSNNHYLLGNGTTTFTSDANAKKNIETTRDGYLEDLASLRVVKYNWKEDEDGTPKELGLIAQEVEEVFPNLVMRDFDPNIADEDKKKMIKVSVLPFMLLKALQEANTKITSLEAKVTALENAE